MDHLEALERAYADGRKLVGSVKEDDFGRPTPCAEWDTRQLLDHLIGAIAVFPALLRGEPPDLSGDFVGDDPAASYRAATDENLAAWARPEALETPAGMLSGVQLVELNLVDAVVHNWDLATALGRDPSLDPAVVEAAYESVRAWPLGASRAAGAFGPPVSVADDAPTLDRLVALLGRKP
jgi:uncharacterized protein (TIGR03086 family)